MLWENNVQKCAMWITIIMSDDYIYYWTNERGIYALNLVGERQGKGNYVGGGDDWEVDISDVWSDQT